MAILTFVLPTKNEEKTIVHIIEGIQSFVSKTDHQLGEIIITDDSRDQTRHLATKAGARVVNGGGKGLGTAMYKGLKQAALGNCDLIISMDSDGQVDIQELELFLKPIEENKADMVLGSRFKGKGLVHYKYPFINRFGIHILVFILRRLTGLSLTDSHGGIRVMRVEIAKELELIGSHTYVQEGIIDAHEKGFRVVEIPSVWKEREHGNSRIVASIPKYIFYTLPVLIIRSGEHIRLLYPLGIFFIFLSILDFLIVGYQTSFSLEQLFERQSFHLILLLFGLGINLFFFGFVIEMLGQIKRRID